MTKIHWGRVILGGLLAGFVANSLQFILNRLYLFGFWRSALQGLNVPTAAGSANRFLLSLMTFVGGIFAVGIYALIRSRGTAGPKTAALAGLVFWLLAWVFPVVLWNLSGPYPALPVWLLAAHLLTYLMVSLAETMAGAWSYRMFGTLAKS
jgi:hypothetical protein